MTQVAPAPPRATITEVPEGLRIVIPARRRRFDILFVGAWLVAWLLSEAVLVTALIAGLWAMSRGMVEVPVGGVVFYVFFLLVWTAVGLLSLAGWLWAVAGRDILTVTDRAVTLRRDVLGRGLTRSFDTARLRALRVVPWWRYNPWVTVGGRRRVLWFRGPIALDCRDGTTRFASGVHEAEAYRIVDRIRERFGVPTDPAPEGG
jgi:hypothetical protein